MNGQMTDATRKRLKFLSEKLIKYANEFRILAGNKCNHWEHPIEYKPALCTYNKSKVDCVPSNCPLRKTHKRINQKGDTL